MKAHDQKPSRWTIFSLYFLKLFTNYLAPISVVIWTAISTGLAIATWHKYQSIQANIEIMIGRFEKMQSILHLGNINNRIWTAEMKAKIRIVEPAEVDSTLLFPLRAIVQPCLKFKTQKLNGPCVHTIFDPIALENKNTTPLVPNYFLETISSKLGDMLGISLFHSRIIFIVSVALIVLVVGYFLWKLLKMVFQNTKLAYFWTRFAPLKFGFTTLWSSLFFTCSQLGTAFYGYTTAMQYTKTNAELSNKARQLMADLEWYNGYKVITSEHLGTLKPSLDTIGDTTLQFLYEYDDKLLKIKSAISEFHATNNFFIENYLIVYKWFNKTIGLSSMATQLLMAFLLVMLVRFFMYFCKRMKLRLAKELVATITTHN